MSESTAEGGGGKKEHPGNGCPTRAQSTGTHADIGQSGGVGQDGHDLQQRRRLVRGLDNKYMVCGLGRLPQQSFRWRPSRRRTGTGRHLPGADLARLWSAAMHVEEAAHRRSQREALSPGEPAQDTSDRSSRRNQRRRGSNGAGPADAARSQHQRLHRRARPHRRYQRTTKQLNRRTRAAPKGRATAGGEARQAP